MAKRSPAADLATEVRARFSEEDWLKADEAHRFGYMQTAEGWKQGRAYRSRSQERSDARKAAAPAGNTGGNYGDVQLVTVDGQILEVPKRRGWGGDSAFIDWLNFTVLEDSFMSEDASIYQSAGSVIISCSTALEKIFGYGIAHKRDKGANFYQTSYELEDGAGLVCHGGQRGTVLVSISGKGLALAAEGWERRLFDWLSNEAIQPRITRIDLAHDDYDGKRYSVDQANTDYDANLFRCAGAGRNPDIEMRGNWKKPNGKGRTVYVGNRENGKFLRVYEKGRQLGDPNSEWVRVELELKAQDRYIPFDVLLKAGEYLAGSYLALNWIRETQQRIKTIQKSAQITYDSMKEWLHVQCGAALNAIRECEEDFLGAVQKLCREELPARLKSMPLKGPRVSLHRMATEADWAFQLA